MDPSGEPGTHERTFGQRGRPIVVQRHVAVPASRTVRSVCATCNNGWMSTLEAKAQRAITSMLRGHRRTYFDGGQTTIASWLMKTALVDGSTLRDPVVRDFYENLYAIREPSPNTRVWLGATIERFAHYTDFRPIRVSDVFGPIRREQNAFSSLISVGEFAGFVVSWLDGPPSLEALLPRFERALVSIWPPSPSGAKWPPRERFDYEGLEMLADSIVHRREVLTRQP